MNGSNNLAVLGNCNLYVREYCKLNVFFSYEAVHDYGLLACNATLFGDS
jgi:hypothetical protein